MWGNPKTRRNGQEHVSRPGAYFAVWSTVSLGALRYVITSAGPTHLISTEDYRTLVTLEDTLAVLRHQFRTEEEVRAFTTNNMTNFRNPEPIMHREDMTMDVALDQLEKARDMVDEQLPRW